MSISQSTFNRVILRLALVALLFLHFTFNSEKSYAQSITYNKGFDISSASFNSSVFSLLAQESDPEAILFNDDGTILYVLGRGGVDISEYSLSTAYDIETASFTQVALNVSGQDATPQDILFNNDGTVLYLLGSTGDDVTEYSLSTAYDISSASFVQIALSVAAEELAPQDFMFNNTGNRLYILGSTTGEIHEYFLSSAYDISTATFLQTALDISGQESEVRAMLFDDSGDLLYVMGNNGDDINEYSLSSSFDISTATFTEVVLSFTAQENSPKDILYNNDGSRLYLVGTNGDDINQYDLAGFFTEDDTNDGNISGSAFITINGDAFDGITDEDFIGSGKASISNVPAGLSEELTWLSATELRLTFTGQATANNDANDVSSLEFTFVNAAVTSGNIAGVANSVGALSGIGIDFNDNFFQQLYH